MFDNLNGWEIIGLLLLALFIFGPERLPKVISDGVRMLRNLRDLARNATSDLSRELGTEVRLEDLHPKTFIRKHLLSEEEEAELRRPFDEAYRDVKQISAEASDYSYGRQQPELPPAQPRARQALLRHRGHVAGWRSLRSRVLRALEPACFRSLALSRLRPARVAAPSLCRGFRRVRSGAGRGACRPATRGVPRADRRLP